MDRKVKPSPVSKYYSLALYYAKLEEYKKAMNYLEWALSINPNHEGSLELKNNMSKFLRQKYKNLELFEYEKPKRIKTLSGEKREYYEKVFRLYNEKGTLESVGNILGLTRERVRQILKKGSNHRLFKYPPKKKSEELIDCDFLLKYFNTREEVSEELSTVGKKSEMLNLLGTDETQFNELLKYFDLTLGDIKRYAKKKECKIEYDNYVKKIGYHPATTEMRDNRSIRNVWARITRYWGSMVEFRKEFHYPMVKPGNPRLREHTREWFQKKSAAAMLKRKIQMEMIRVNLSETEVMSKRELAHACNIDEQICLILLNLMIKKGDIIRVGSGARTVYKLRKDQ